MPSTPSPLRYPGGKSSVLNMVSEIIHTNNLSGCSYAEPYAGGCGLALNLLLKGHVDKIYLNDYDSSIWSFWHSVLDAPDKLIKKILETPVTIDEWKKQRHIYGTPDEYSTLERGFSTLFLNRTNRSGIIKAGFIGGAAQDGKYKIDCRFGKKGLVERIERIQDFKSRVFLYNLDALDFFEATDGLLAKDGFYCIDPPYYKKGHTLYANFYKHDDHVKLASKISKLETKWILTYDNASEIKSLYPTKNQYLFNLNYSAGAKRKGTELLVVSDVITIGSGINISKLVI